MHNGLEKRFVIVGGDKTVECRVASGFMEAGKRGQYFGKFFCGQWWAIVKWDEEDDPETFKADGVEIGSQAWVKP